MDQVDQHRPAAGFAPPGGIEVGRGFEPYRHGGGGDRAAQHTFVHQLPGAAHDGIVTALVSGQERDAGGSGGVAQAAPVGHRVGNRLFHQGNDAARDAVKADSQVRRIRRGHDRGGRFHGVDHRTVIRVPRQVEAGSESTARFCGVGNRRDADLGRSERARNVRATDESHADHGDGQAGSRGGSGHEPGRENQNPDLNRRGASHY